jgi:shikimate kinase
MKRVVLVGMMGCGKTTIGRILAQEMDVPFEDTDQILQRLLGRPVHQLFELYGEDTFRQHESKVLRDLPIVDRVLATGGGAVIREQNWTELERLGTTVWLDVAPEVLIERLQTAKRRRPLLEVENWEERFMDLREQRLSAYQRAHHHVRLEEQDFDSVVKEILCLIQK